jgi:levansucrase
MRAPATAVSLPARWTGSHVQALQQSGYDTTYLLGEKDLARVSAELDIWDAWPIQAQDGAPALLHGSATLWMALASPRFDHPDERHSHARIHLILRQEGRWRDLGPAMPDGFSPGSREWSGSAVLSEDLQLVTLYFTASGRRGEHQLSFEQRLFSARATLEHRLDGWALNDWRDLKEIVRRDPDHYMDTANAGGTVGTIKAFRDPAYFWDPVRERHFLFFAASQANSGSSYNGVIGWATTDDPEDDRWRILPPLVSADGLNNELERPHAIHHAGRYYLFWSTQSHVFDPEGPVGPTGLYGMTSLDLGHGWEPLNGTGLVLANPAASPRQAYSWLVMPDMQVTSFVDDWGDKTSGAPARRFGATFAPLVRIWLEGSGAGIAR